MAAEKFEPLGWGYNAPSIVVVFDPKPKPRRRKMREWSMFGAGLLAATVGWFAVGHLNNDKELHAMKIQRLPTIESDLKEIRQDTKEIRKDVGQVQNDLSEIKGRLAPR